MPYFITDKHPECDNFAVVKEDGELIACHASEDEAIAQMVAISISEDLEPGGTYEGEEFRIALPGDKFTTKEEALDRAKAIGCAGYHTMTSDGETIFMPCDTHSEYEKLVEGGSGYSSYRNDEASTPAPEEDQIFGSEKNPEGSAADEDGDIELSDSTETALENKVEEHNQKMMDDDRPDWTRASIGQLRAVYRRGSGAYSTSHRPNVSRAAWSMARVNAFLYLLETGSPKNALYISDNDLLPVGHPKSTKENGDSERDVNLAPPAYMRAAARRGLEYYSEGLGGDGLVDRTIEEARAMAAGNVSPDKWSRMVSWISRHLVDLDAPAADPSNEGYPSPGVVAHLLWGSGPSKRAAERVLKYAKDVVAKIEADNIGLARGESVKKLETRTNITEIEFREDGDGMSFEGYAAVFDSDSQPLPFIERIKRGAFSRSLKSRNNVFFYWNHDSGQVLGSTRAGTLSLQEDDKGLKVRAKLPNTTLGRDVAELVRTQVIDSLSFGFSTIKDSWDESGNRRTLEAVRLHEVSLTPVPAYEGTAGSASVRGLDLIAQRADVDAEGLATTLLKIEEGEDISTEEKSLVSKVLDTLSPDPEVEESEGLTEEDSLGLLLLKKKKLEILEALNGQ
jgi:HK97 family phage prohead protease